MTETTQVALITFVVGPAVLALVSWLLTRKKLDRIDRNSAITRDQVANDHPTNLREEQDTRHDENQSILARIVATQAGQGKAIGGIRDTLRILAEADLLTVRRVDHLEDTIPRDQLYRPPNPARHRQELHP